jgi:outer membrane protein assembly factor BamB
MAGGAARYRAVAVVVGWWALAAPAAELPRLPGMTQRGVQRFADAADLEQQRRWPEAVEAYLRIVDDAGDDLVPSDDPRLVLPARRVVHRRLASRSQLLGPYRERVEGRARQLLDRGRADRDPQPLLELLDQFFCSRSAEAALHLLGDLACERGDFDAARTYWQLLLPATGREFTYPDPQGDPALVRAKLVLARLLAGEREEAVVEFRAFRKQHPKAEGYLAGRQGALVATLQALFDAADVAVRRPSPEPPHPPTTFAADAARTGLVAGLLPPDAPRQKYKPIALPDAPLPPPQGRVVQVPLVRTRDLAFYPVVAFGHVLVADHRRISAYDLATGRLAPGQFDLVQTGLDLQFKGDAIRRADFGRMDPAFTDRHDARYTLTVDGDRVYARLGFPDISSEPEIAVSRLVCLPWQASAEGGGFGKRKWILPAMKDANDPVTFFEGTPVVHEGRLYVGVTRFENNRATTAVACYDADDPRSGPIWQQDVGESGPATGRRYRAHLLTVAQGMVVCATHAGAVVALDAGTGRRVWAVRYPSRGTMTAIGEPSPRDLTPAVAADGRIFVAPADHDRVLGLDGRTGTILWESATIEVAHLLGVANDWLVCQLGGYVSGLTALNVATGRPAAWGYQRAGAKDGAPFGRGFLVQDRVVWPTRRTGVQQLQWNGDLVRQPVAFMGEGTVPGGRPGLPGGNLAYGDGCLVVATADKLHILLADPLDAKAADARKPTDGATWLWEAERRRQTNRPAADVRAAYQAAADWARGKLPAERLDAQTRLAEFESAGGHVPEAVKAWRAVLEADDLRHRSVLDAAGRWRSVRTWAIRELDQLRADGTDFTDLERAAAAESDLSTRADRFPNAMATRTDLLAAAQKAEKAGRAAEAVTRYRQLLGCLAAEDDKEIRAAVDRLTLADAAVPSSDGRDEPPKAANTNKLSPAWRVRLAGPEQWAVLPEGISPTADVLYVAATGRIAARALPDGHDLWQRDLLFTSDWVAPLADSVLVAGADGAARLAASDGRVIWQLRVPEPAAAFGAPAGWRDAETPDAAAGLSGFRVAGGRLFARVAAGLIALDVETGQVAWQWVGNSRPPGRNNGFSPHYHADAATIVLQNDGRRYLLEAATGQMRATGPAPADPWPSAAAPLDARRLAVAENGHVVAIDKSSGAVAWTYELADWPSLTGEPAQLRLEGTTLLVGVPRNDGFEIVRLDPATGKPRGPSLAAGHGRIDLTATAVIDDTLYFADGGLLTRLVPRMGRRPFPRQLDAGGSMRLLPTSWRVDRLGSSGLLLSPASLRGVESDASEPPVTRGQFWVVGTQGEVSFEPIPFQNAGPHAAVRAGPDGFVFATSAEVVGYRFTKREGR